MASSASLIGPAASSCLTRPAARKLARASALSQRPQPLRQQTHRWVPRDQRSLGARLKESTIRYGPFVARASSNTSLGDAEAVPVRSASRIFIPAHLSISPGWGARRTEDGNVCELPSAAGIYAIYDKDGSLQYVGLSRKARLMTATASSASPALSEPSLCVPPPSPRSMRA